MSITLPSLSNHIRSHPGMIHPEPAHIAGQCSSHPQNQTPPQPQAQIDTNTIQYFLPGALYTFTISFALGGSGDANNDAAVKNVFLGEFTLHLDNGAREPIFAHVIQGLPEGAWSEGAVNTGMVSFFFIQGFGQWRRRMMRKLTLKCR